MRARFYAPDDAPAWDAFCARATSATFLHTRRFLSYHGDRFDDRSIVLEDDAGRWLGAMPAAVDPRDPTLAVSHPGITYGGIVHDGALRGAAMLDALRAAAAVLAARGHSRLRYKAVPTIYHRRPAQDDAWALFAAGASRVRCDLSTCIDLAARGPVSDRRRRGARRAVRDGLEVREGTAQAAPFWTVLEETLARRHGVRPVHALDEIVLLAGRFPSEIAFFVAARGEAVLGGTVLFRCGPVVHAQYIAASEEGTASGALDLVLEHCIGRAAADGARWFDFGISSESQGTVLNEGLYRFKAEFGGAGVVHEFYELPLEDTRVRISPA